MGFRAVGAEEASVVEEEQATGALDGTLQAEEEDDGECQRGEADEHRPRRTSSVDGGGRLGTEDDGEKTEQHDGTILALMQGVESELVLSAEAGVPLEDFVVGARRRLGGGGRAGVLHGLEDLL